MFQSKLWAIDPAGWSVDAAHDSVSFASCDVDAALVFSALHLGEGVFTDQDVAFLVNRGAPPSAVRTEIACGDFRGFHTEYEDNGTHWRVWWLFLDDLHLYASYNCDGKDAGRHDAVVNWMFSTLRRADRSSP